MRHHLSAYLLAPLTLLALLATPAMAQERAVEARGSADSSDGDIRAARVRAIDNALADAVGQALADTLDARARARHRKTLNAEIVRRARRFVAGFQVQSEASDDDRYRVRIRARVDMDKLTARLGELGIETRVPNGQGAGPDAGQGTDQPMGGASEPRPKVVALIHTTLGERVHTSFGTQGASDGPGAKTVIDRLDEQGFTVTSAIGAEVPAARERPAGIPLSDAAAATIAARVGAGGAFVLGVKSWREGPIRATSLVGALATASIRVVDLRGPSGGESGGESGGQVLASAEVRAAGFGETEEQALADAAARAAERAVRAVMAAAVAHWPPSINADDAMLVEVRRYRGWSDIRALRKQLENTHGITRVWPRQLGRRGVVLAVSTDINRRRVAAALRKVILEGARVDTRARGDRDLLVNLIRVADSPGADRGANP